MRIRHGFLAACAGACLVFFSQVSFADPSISFTYNDLYATLHVTLTNTDATALTSVSLNIPEQVGDVTKFEGADGWSYLFNPDNIASNGQAGKFDLLIFTGMGGLPNTPALPGQSLEFTIIFSNDTTGVTSENFLTEQSPIVSLPASSALPVSSATRASTPSGSAAISNITPVPEPSTLILLGVGLIGGIALARKRKSSSR